jgi:hypothetical protein
MFEPAAVPVSPNRVSVKQFFEAVAPGKNTQVKDLGRKSAGPGVSWFMQTSAIELHCESESCHGTRFFEPAENEYLTPKKRKEHFLTFVCRNCRESAKTYAFWSCLSEDGINGELMKFGEDPPFGPPTPAKVITLIGSEREYFLKGRRAENQGLGIAAFAYYRRVVEKQKSKIIDEIVRVAQKVGATPEVLRDLEAARAETQFSKAVNAIRHGIPQSLLIDGHNPLALLHSALSDGLHAQTDKQCLDLATDIRIVLTELVERISTALKEEVELNVAVSRLLRANGERTERSANGE